MMNLDEILSHLSFGIIFISKDGNISFINSSAETILDCNKDEILQKPYSDFFSDSLFGFSMQKALKGEEKKKTILLTLKNESRSQPLEISFSYLPESGLIIELKDGSELRKMKQTLDRNDRLKEVGEMAARLAHEIRNPLGGIMGFAELLSQDLKEDSKKSMMVKSIIEGTKLLNRLVTNVLHFARPLQVHFASQSLVEIVQKVISLVEVEKKIPLQLQYDDKTMRVMIDEDLFQMALLNLLRNSCEATIQGKVTVKLYKKNEKSYIAIKDEGPGIEKEHLEKIFTPFFTTKQEGSGLGLSEANKVIEALGGKIEVETSKQGSTFTIVI